MTVFREHDAIWHRFHEGTPDYATLCEQHRNAREAHQRELADIEAERVRRGRDRLLADIATERTKEPTAAYMTGFTCNYGHHWGDGPCEGQIAWFQRLKQSMMRHASERAKHLSVVDAYLLGAEHAHLIETVMTEV